MSEIAKQRTVKIYDGEWCGKKLSWGNVDKSTVCRTVKLFDRTGNVTKKSYSYASGQSLRKLTRPVELSILHVVLSHPGIYLREIKSELPETHWC